MDIDQELSPKRPWLRGLASRLQAFLKGADTSGGYKPVGISEEEEGLAQSPAQHAAGTTICTTSVSILLRVLLWLSEPLQVSVRYSIHGHSNSVQPMFATPLSGSSS